MWQRNFHGNERGIALVVVLLVLVAVAAIVGGAAIIGSNTSLINKYHDRLSVLETAADAGLEQARSAINANKALYPDTGFSALENGAAVYAADGTVIPNVKRWTYVGPTGVVSGQYGFFGSIVSVVEDPQGNRVVRRSDVFQESFAKYAYFTTDEGSIVFGPDNQLFGPVYSADNITIGSGSPKPTFWGPVATAGVINNKTNAIFKQGYTENAPAIAMPATAALTKLKSQALIGNTSIAGSALPAAAGQATVRIEFVALDLNADGDSIDENEGFMKVYRAASTATAYWVVADTNGYAGTGANNGLRNSPNCGHWVNPPGVAFHTAAFTTFFSHVGLTAGNADRKANAPNMSGGTVTRRCFLGGSNTLNANVANPNGMFVVNNVLPLAPFTVLGAWQLWPGPVSPLVVGRPDGAYLWPLNRALNANFKGVVYVEGKVAVSGRLRGQVTLAASGNIIIADDITYATAPGAQGRNCRDMLGLFSGTDVLVADNLINNPYPYLQGTANVTWDETKDEFVHAVVLALNQFTLEHYNTDPADFEDCEGTNRGRGCLYLTGGIIQKNRGPVGLTSGEGNLKRYSYDACGASNPPPYFPTTGRFSRGHFYEVEPTGFNISAYYSMLAGGL